ncbi:ATP-binding protein [Niveispirillum irakense]|uniref:ATP-binding protein n=1 Tax=Niveispirillum irakense TaxID=34011 RepID=UPI0012B57AD3|nr:ATP-binding protein [Niveispirillum irakense]
MTSTLPGTPPPPLPPLPAFLVGGTLPPDELAATAIRHGLTVADPEKGEKPQIFLTALADPRQLINVLASGCRAYVERRGAADLTEDGLSRLVERPRSLHLCLTTAGTFGLDLAPLLCAAMELRGWLPPMRRGDIEICLHEALNNALIHGNLGLKEGPGGEEGAFDRFYAEIRRRLDDPDRARRRVIIDAAADAGGLCITIQDQGEGHKAHQGRSLAPPDAKSGRGIQIMRELADDVVFSDGGRRVMLIFRP